MSIRYIYCCSALMETFRRGQTYEALVRCLKYACSSDRSILSFILITKSKFPRSHEGLTKFRSKPFPRSVTALCHCLCSGHFNSYRGSLANTGAKTRAPIKIVKMLLKAAIPQVRRHTESPNADGRKPGVPNAVSISTAKSMPCEEGHGRNLGTR